MSDENTVTEKQSLLYQIVTFPKSIGQLVFELIKNDDAEDYAKILVGYGILLATILLLLSIFSPETLKTLLLFFFPPSSIR